MARVALSLSIVLLLGAGVLVAAGNSMPERATVLEPPSTPASEPSAPTGSPTAAATPADIVADAATSPATTATVAPAPVARAQPKIADRLRRILRRSGVKGTVGVVVLDERRRAVFSADADRPLLPASTQKVLVAAAALARLGPEHRYTTVVGTTAAPGPDGVVRGDLVIVGGGDPALASPEYGRIRPDRPRTPMERLVRQIRAAGVTRVTGRILADPSIFENQPTAAGWLPRYFRHLDTTASSGLTVDAGRELRRRGGQFYAEAAEDPARQTARVLRRMLRDRGVDVDGRALSVAAAPPTVGQLAHVSSPPLRDILRYMVQRSDNHLADTVFRTLGAADGEATWVGSAGATARALAPLELDWSGVVLADGSGLSRSNRLSPTFLASLQGRMWTSSLGAEYRRLLAVAGRNGTLRSRLRDTQAERRLYGKTGSLRDVRALTGSIVGPGGRRLDVAVVGNGLQGRSVGRMSTLADRLLRAAAEDLYECRRVRPKGRRPDGRRKPVRLVCAAG